MNLKIIELGDNRLLQKSQEVPLPLSEEDQKLAQDLNDYLDYAALPTNNERPGVGIAAVQVGVLKRMFAIRVPFTDDEYFREVLVNPKITYRNGRAALADGEGCLSVPEDRSGLVHRNNEITVKGYSAIKKEEVEYELSGYLAIVFQHEYDHLEGKLYFNRINPIEPNKPKTKEVLI